MVFFISENSTEEGLFKNLRDEKVDKIYLFDCKENAEKRELKIVHVLSTQPVIGAEVQLVEEMNDRKVKKTFDKCLEKWAHDYEDDDVYLERVARKILKEEGWESQIPETEVGSIFSNILYNYYSTTSKLIPHRGIRGGGGAGGRNPSLDFRWVKKP